MSLGWSPPRGQPLLDHLCNGDPDDCLDLGCIAAHGIFTCDDGGIVAVAPTNRAATAFLLELIARLQAMATVPIIDVRAYARWLTDEPSSA